MLKVGNKKNPHVEQGKTKKLMGIVLHRMAMISPEKRKIESFDRVIVAYREALEVWDPLNSPEAYATTHGAMAETFNKLAPFLSGNAQAEALDHAAQSFNKYTEIYELKRISPKVFLRAVSDGDPAKMEAKWTIWETIKDNPEEFMANLKKPSKIKVPRHSPWALKKINRLIKEM